MPKTIHRTRAIAMRQYELAVEEAEREGRDYIELPLTQGYTTKVSLADVPKVKMLGAWCVVVSRKGDAINGMTRVMHHNRGQIYVYLSRWIMGVEPEDNVTVEHVNGDRLDNRRENLIVIPMQPVF